MKFSFVVASPLIVSFLSIVYTQTYNKTTEELSTHPLPVIEHGKLLKVNNSSHLYSLECDQGYKSSVERSIIKCEENGSCTPNDLQCTELSIHPLPVIEHGKLLKVNNSNHLYSLECDQGYKSSVERSIINCEENGSCTPNDLLCTAHKSAIGLLCKQLLMFLVPSALVFIILMVIIAAILRRCKRSEEPMTKWARGQEARRKKSEGEGKAYAGLVEVSRLSFRFPFYFPKGPPTGKKRMPLKVDENLDYEQSVERCDTTMIDRNKSVDLNAVSTGQGVESKQRSDTLSERVIKELQKKLPTCTINCRLKEQVPEVETQTRKDIATAETGKRNSLCRQMEQTHGVSSNLRPRPSDVGLSDCSGLTNSAKEQQTVQKQHDNGCTSRNRSLTPSPRRNKNAINLPCAHSLKESISEPSLGYRDDQRKRKCSAPLQNPQGGRISPGSILQTERDSHITQRKSIASPENPYLELDHILMLEFVDNEKEGTRKKPLYYNLAFNSGNEASNTEEPNHDVYENMYERLA